MSYKKLYDHCQALDVPISRNTVRDEVLRLTGANRVAIVKTTLDESVCRGFYLSAKNSNHRIVEQHGCNVICVSRSLNRCWTRFVVVKELMHMLDGAASATDSGDDLEKVLTELTGPGAPAPSPQMDAEVACFWKALAALAPEKERLGYKALRAEAKIDDYAIALKLRIPQQYVSRLFIPRYEQIVGIITAQ